MSKQIILSIGLIIICASCGPSFMLAHGGSLFPGSDKTVASAHVSDKAKLTASAPAREKAWNVIDTLGNILSKKKFYFDNIRGGPTRFHNGVCPLIANMNGHEGYPGMVLINRRF